MNVARCGVCGWRAMLAGDPCCRTCQERVQLLMQPPLPMRQQETRARQLTMRLEARWQDS